MIRWGSQNRHEADHSQPDAATAGSRVAGYLAKYATKDAQLRRRTRTDGSGSRE